MAELILGAVAFGVAGPGVIIAFAECGEYIQKKVQKFKDAPAIIKELGRFGRDLHQGQIKINLELAEWADSLPDIDQIIKDSIGDYIIKLRTVLIEVEHCLSSMIDKNGQLRRFYFTLVGERKAQQIVKNLKRWQIDFFNVIHLIEMRRRVLSSDVSLPWNKTGQNHAAGFLFILTYLLELPRSSETIAQQPYQFLSNRNTSTTQTLYRTSEK
jgi:hypothetical protein